MQEGSEAGGLLFGEAALALQRQRQVRGGDAHLLCDLGLQVAAVLDEVRNEGEGLGVSGEWHEVHLPVRCVP